MSSQYRAVPPLALASSIDHPHQTSGHLESSWGFGALAKIASYAVALARTDSLKKSVVFFGRTLVQWKKALRWIDYLEHYGRRTRLGQPPVELIRKSLGTYFLYQASAIETHERLVDHFETAARVIRRDMLEKLWDGEQVELASIAGKQNSYRVTLCRADQAGSRHEGELTVAFTGPLLSGPLCRMTFIFVRQPNGGFTLAVGSTQGTNQADGKAAIVAATRDLNGLRPKDAMLLTLKGLAHRLGADEIFAVANDSHVINRRRASRRKRMWTDLDSYWIDRGGVEGGPFGYRLAIEDLSTASVPSNRRDAMKKAFWDVGGMAL